MTHKKSGSKTEQGTALVATLMFLMAMGVLSTALVFTVQNEMKTSTSYKYGQQSFYEANAAVQDAVQWFANSYNPYGNAAVYDLTVRPVQYQGSDVMLAGKAGDTSVYPDSSVISTFSSAFTNKTLEANDNNSGGYAVNGTLLKHIVTQCIDTETFVLSPCAIERWRLDSLGYWGSTAKPLGLSQITAMIENNGAAFFDRALWGKSSVDLRGAMLIDSYDPRLGVWDPDTNSGYNGAIGSNQLIDMVGDATVYGDVGIGPTGEYNPGGTVTGNVVRLSEDREFPPIPEFEVGTQNVSVAPTYDEDNPYIIENLGSDGNKYGRISVRGILIFEPGEYYIDELMSTAQGQIVVTGDTRLYIKSGLTLTGQGIVNSGTDPNQLQIFYSGDSAVTFEGGSTAYVELYAPNSDVTLRGNTDFSGSFIGDNVTATGGAQIHFSNGCLKSPLVKRPFRLITWSQDSY